MGKKKNKPLTQAEIWDDSALLQSWDEALEEYKLYHSIHARGERVEDVLRLAEQDELDAADPSSSALKDDANGASTKDIEDGELEEEDMETDPGVDMTKVKPETSNNKLAATAQQLASNGPSGHNVSSMSMPNPVLGGVQDEALKNLMMSWYYAGYYTGLYEGQQKASQNQMPSKNSN